MRTLRDLRVVALLVVVLGLAYLLPPDTSWAQVARAGVLRVCLPERYPPLVTGDATAPGIDVEILRAVASRLHLDLQLVANPAMGRDFNPRNWRVTRAQCQVLAGGVIASATTRSFLETTPPYLQTGWAAVAPAPQPPLDGARVAVLAGSTGLDRIALSGVLRDARAEVRLVPDADALAAALEDGSADLGVSEALAARAVAGAHGWTVRWVPGAGDHPGMALGLWKGDLTLKRRIVGALRALRSDGTLAGILAHYHLAPIAEPGRGE